MQSLSLIVLSFLFILMQLLLLVRNGRKGGTWVDNSFCRNNWRTFDATDTVKHLPSGPQPLGPDPVPTEVCFGAGSHIGLVGIQPAGRGRASKPGLWSSILY